MMVTTATAQSESRSSTDLRDLRIFVFGLFFIFGGITSLNDVLIPKLKGLFTLSHADAMLVQSAFFAAYFIICVAIVGGAIVPRVTGLAMDWINASDVKCGLSIPAICYAIILAFGVYARRPET
jgi:MFS transporter, FHS family, L-fucose permease